MFPSINLIQSQCPQDSRLIHIQQKTTSLMDVMAHSGPCYVLYHRHNLTLMVEVISNNSIAILYSCRATANFKCDDTSTISEAQHII